MAADMSDLADGVKEGARLTAQDTKVITQKLKEEHKEKGGLVGILGDKLAQSGIRAGTEPGSTDDPNDSGNQRPDALQSIRQGISSTAEVSKQMLQDLREANKEVVSEFRVAVKEIRHSMQQPDRASQASDSAGPAQSTEERSPGDGASLREEGDAGPAAVQSGPQVSSPCEALELFQQELESRTSEPQAGDSSHKPLDDGRTDAERRYDEQAKEASTRVKQVAQASGALWQKTADSLRSGFQQAAAMIPERLPDRGASGSDGSTMGSTEGSAFWAMPSTRANYVSLEVPQSASSSLPASSPAPSTSGAAVAGSENSDVQTPQEGGLGALRRARKIGGRLVKRTTEVSQGLVRQATDLGEQVGQKIEDSIAPAFQAQSAEASGPKPQSREGVGSAADAEFADDDIFEIGGSDDEAWDDAGKDEASDASAAERKPVPHVSTDDAVPAFEASQPSAVVGSTQSPAAPEQKVASSDDAMDEFDAMFADITSDKAPSVATPAASTRPDVATSFAVQSDPFADLTFNSEAAVVQPSSHTAGSTDTKEVGGGTAAAKAGDIDDEFDQLWASIEDDDK
eukprot:gnl/TRDRNA2_/TRDRNA2_166354_c1_seq1.p1 gnl/TRDRNA2_/TRDRNA2_166354_c1~~gnl/TRDRNA2_/TRDRNA2_166354_c1_seq1.p1  ORF type:complete len:653 (+),score=138.33 gnl/TRDRNA2_/TRDRNA2_166354_c1_seq1:247-1959(+)